MKVSLRNGRGSACHNDRTAGIGSHVDRDSIANDCYYIGGRWITDLPSPLEELELKAYDKLFGDWLNYRNMKSMASRHSDRVKDMQAVYTTKRYEPHEMILQIGNVVQAPDPEVLKRVVQAFVDEIQRNSKGHIKTLDASLHLDESTPHVHLRYVVTATKDGHTMPALEKGLEQMGVEPMSANGKQTDKIGKFNNREIRLTHDLRERFIELTEQELGITIERGHNAQPHADKGEYIRRREQEYNDRMLAVAEKEYELDKLAEKLEGHKQTVNTALQEIEAIAPDLAERVRQQTIAENRKRVQKKEKGMSR